MLLKKYCIPRNPKTDMYSKSLVPQKNNYSVAVNTASNECIISIDLNFSMGGNIVEDSKMSKVLIVLKYSKRVPRYLKIVFIYKSSVGLLV